MKQLRLLPLALLLLTLWGCGSRERAPKSDFETEFSSSSEPTTISVFSAAPEPVSYPLEPCTLTLFTFSELSPGDRQLLSAMQEATGVTLTVDSGAAQESLNADIAAGDLFDLYLNLPDYLLGGDDFGVTLNLTELLSQHAPSYISAVNALEGGPQAAASLSHGGYSMCILMDEPMVQSNFGLVLRQDWLEELGYAAPETYQDYHDLFLAMKNAYAPKLPFWLPQTGVTDGNHFCAGYDISLGSRSYFRGFYQTDGTVRFGPQEQGFTDYLTMLRLWYQEGILNNTFLDQIDFQSNSYLIDLSTGAYGAFFLPLESYDLLSGMCSFPITPAMDPVRERGDSTHLTQNSTQVIYGTGYSVSVDCADPALAVEALDWLYSPEARLLGAYGQEGESYEWRDGSPAYTELILNNPQGLTVSEALSVYTAPQLSAAVSPSAMALVQESPQAQEVWGRQKDGDHMLPQGIQLTQAEQEEYADLATDISTYVDSVIPQFILGELSLEQIPEIQAHIRELDVDLCLQLWQRALDRYNRQEFIEE